MKKEEFQFLESIQEENVFFKNNLQYEKLNLDESQKTQFQM